VTDGLAQGRPVILFNNAGVASSSGETPNTIDAMGDHLGAFVNALGLPQIDVLGFSKLFLEATRRLCDQPDALVKPPGRESQM
jgi:hypothetical protein